MDPMGRDGTWKQNAKCCCFVLICFDNEIVPCPYWEVALNNQDTISGTSIAPENGWLEPYSLYGGFYCQARWRLPKVLILEPSTNQPIKFYLRTIVHT